MHEHPPSDVPLKLENSSILVSGSMSREHTCPISGGQHHCDPIGPLPVSKTGAWVVFVVLLKPRQADGIKSEALESKIQNVVQQTRQLKQAAI